MADEEKRPDEEQRNSDPEFEEDPAPPSDPAFETDEPSPVEEASSAKEEEGKDAARSSSSASGADDEPPAAEVASKGKDDDASGSHHGIGHVAPMPLLIGVLAALILLTILTVGVTAVDLGSQGNFVVAMVIATVKAVLVMGYFMHLFWDNKFNVVAFGSSFLFAALFLAMALLDRQETQPSIDAWEVDQQIMQQQ